MYAGHRGEERPSAMIFGGREVAIIALRTARIEEDYRTRERRRFFEVLGDDGMEYLLCLSEASGVWSVRGPL